MGFVKGKPKATNLAIMGNPIDVYAVNSSKKQSILLLKKKSKLSEPRTIQKTKQKINNKPHVV